MYWLFPTMKTLREKFKIQRFSPWHNMKVGSSSPISDFVGLWVNMQRIWSPPWFLILSFVLERDSVPVCSWGAPAAPAWALHPPGRHPSLRGCVCLPGGFRSYSSSTPSLSWSRILTRRSITLSTLHPPNLENMPPSPQGMNSEQNCSQYFVTCQREGWRAERASSGFSFSLCQLFWA